MIVLLVLGASLFAGKLINESETPPFESDVSENDGFYVGNSTDTTENAEKTTTLQNTNAAKRVNVVSKLSGEMLSMLSLNDGTVVYIESISDECHIKTSTGIDKVLKVKGDDCHLLYNTYADKLYLFYDDGNYPVIYLLDESFSMGSLYFIMS